MKIIFNQHLFKSLGFKVAFILFLLFNQVVFAAAGKFLFVNGDVSVLGANGQSYQAKKGGEINEGDAVVTSSSGYAQIKMEDGGSVSVRPDTNFKVNKFQFDGKEDGSEKSFFSLSKGSVRAVTGLVGKKHRENYKIETATATIGVRGSGADVGHSDAIGSAVHTLFGGHSISTTVEGKTFTLETRPGQTALVVPGSAPQYVPSFPFSTAAAPVTKSEGQKEDKPADKPADKSEDKPADKSEDKPADKSEDKPGDKSGDKPADKSGDKPADKSGDKPADKSGDKSGDKPAPPSGDKPAPPSGDKPAPPSGDKPAPPSGDKPAPPSGDKPAPPSGDKPTPPAQSTTGAANGGSVNSPSQAQSTAGAVNGGSVNSPRPTQSAIANSPLPTTSSLGISPSAPLNMPSNVGPSNGLIAAPSTMFASSVPIVTNISTTTGVELTSASSVTSAIVAIQAATEQEALTQLASQNTRELNSFEMPVNSNMSVFQKTALTAGTLSVTSSVVDVTAANLQKVDDTSRFLTRLSSSSAITSSPSSSSAITSSPSSSSAITSSPSSSSPITYNSIKAITVGKSGVGNFGIISNSEALIGQSVPEVTFFASDRTSPLATQTISWLLTGGYPSLVDNFHSGFPINTDGVNNINTSGSYDINDLATAVRVGAYSRLSIYQDYIPYNNSRSWNLVIDNQTNAPAFYDLKGEFSDASSFYLTPSGTSSFYVGLVNNDILANKESSAVQTTNLSEVGSGLGVNWGRYTIQSASSASGVNPAPNTYHVIEAINLMNKDTLARLALQPSTGIIGYQNLSPTTSPTNELGQTGIITKANASVNFSSGAMTLSISGAPNPNLSNTAGLGVYSATSINGTISKFMANGIDMNGTCSGGGCGSGSMPIIGNATGGFISALPTSSEIPIPGAVISTFSLKNANGNAAIGTVYIKK